MMRRGDEIYTLAERLYPICRSITGDGVRETLSIIREYIPIEVHEVPSGTRVFDWTIPKEWNISDAYVKNTKGEKVIDFKESNLHVLNYSSPIRANLPLSKLKKHIYTLPEYPQWIPYRTSYYKENWGFCMAHNEFKMLEEDIYEVVIDSTLRDGSLTYGELYLKGEVSDEFLISTYLCHPSLANDNISGVALTTLLAQVLSAKKLIYSYRFLFIPETIGAITWLAQNQAHTEKIKYGLVVTCVGDRGISTYKKSRKGNHIIDRAVEKVLIDSGKPYNILDFFPTGSDERQFCSPRFNLPVGSLMRTPYACYPEYHTSTDDLSFIDVDALYDSFLKYEKVVEVIEKGTIPNIFGAAEKKTDSQKESGVYINTKPDVEPFLGAYNLTKEIGGDKKDADREVISWILNFSDGTNSLLDISIQSGLPLTLIKDAADILVRNNLLKIKRD